MVVDEVQNGVYTYKAFLLLLTMGLLDSFDMTANAYNILICWCLQHCDLNDSLIYIFVFYTVIREAMRETRDALAMGSDGREFCK